MKLVKIEFGIELLESILTARNNVFVETDCPEDVKIVKVIQSEDDQSNHRIVLLLQSEEADWVDIKMNGPGAWVEAIPFIDPFQYTVVDPDEDESPPPTKETAP